MPLSISQFNVATAIYLTIFLAIILVLWKYGFSGCILRMSNLFFGIIFSYHDKTLGSRFREDFKFVVLTNYRAGKVTNHAHKLSADLRCNGTTSINKFIASNGRKRFDVSTSTREEKFRAEGTRTVYDMADISQRLRSDVMQDDHVCTFIDVDYYLKDFSEYQGKPMLIYTAIPDAVAGGNAESHYYFDHNLKYVEVINGGGIYESSLWDFSHDNVIIKGYNSFTQYAVEIVPQPGSVNRCVVGLFPRVTVRLPFWLFSLIAWIIGISLRNANILKRTTNVIKTAGYIIGRFEFDGKTMMSFKRDNSTYRECTNIPEALYDTLKDQKAMTSVYHVGDVERSCKDYLGEKNSKTKLFDWVLLASILKCGIEKPFKVNYQVRHPESGLDYETGKTVAQLGGEPIVNIVSAAPTESLNNELFCRDGRVTLLKNVTEPGPKYKKWAIEFLALLIPNKQMHKGNPVDRQVVIDHQSKALQRARQAKEAPHCEKRKGGIRTIQKKENAKAGSLGCPRNVSTVTQTQTQQLSRYAYAFKVDVMKKHKFYMPGQKPEQIVKNVRDYCRDVDYDTVETDYTRFDSSMSRFLREDVEFESYRRWVSKEHLAQLNDRLKCEVKQKGRMPHGTVYEQDYGRASGSPVTTEGNTIINAFVAYAAYREAQIAPKKAFALIGPKYGDDGIDKAVGKFTDVCNELGLKIKEEKNGRQPTFLGRLYLDVMSSDTTFADPLKVLTKVPVLCKMGDKMSALKDKVTGYLVTENFVPLTSHYLHALMRVYELDDVVDTHQPDHDVEHRRNMGPYPFKGDIEELRAEIGRRVNLNPLELDELCQRLDSAGNVQDLESIKLYIGETSPELRACMC